MYSEDDLKKAAEFRNEIHQEALSKVRVYYPDIRHAVDKYPADAYFDQVWDYPGKWYTVISTPPGSGSRKDLVDAIVRDTLEHCRNTGASYTDGAFYRLIAEYPGQS